MYMLDQGLAHISQLKPGTRVQDHSRYRKTVLEITTLPQETFSSALFGHWMDMGRAVASSWQVGVRNLKTNHLETTRIDCDPSGHTDRFTVLA